MCVGLLGSERVRIANSCFMWCIDTVERYWNDEEQTRSVMQKDDSGVLWMHTGDQGILDEEGYLSSSSSFLIPTKRIFY